MDSDVALIAQSYRSFALSLRGPASRCDAVLSLLRASRLALDTWNVCEARTRAFFAHRALHLLAKVLELLAPRLPRAVLYTCAAWLAASLKGAANELANASDLYGFAQLEDLRAQMLTLRRGWTRSGEQRTHRDALSAATVVQAIFYSIGQANSMIMADRTLGWVLSVREDLVPAIEAFSRGVARAESPEVDPTLLPKLQANLLRLLRKSNDASAAATLEESLRDRYGAAYGALAAALDQFPDPRRHPIFLPPEPPPTGR